MNGIKTENGGFEPVVFESVIDVLAGGVGINKTGFTNADGIIPAGTAVGAKDPVTGLCKIKLAVGDKAIGLVAKSVKLDDNPIVSVVVSGVVRKAVCPAETITHLADFSQITFI